VAVAGALGVMSVMAVVLEKVGGHIGEGGTIYCRLYIFIKYLYDLYIILL